MKKNNIKVSIVVCLSILVSLMCFYCMSINGHCKVTLEGYWDPSGQYHEYPPEKEYTPEEEYNIAIENLRFLGWSEEEIQSSIPTIRKRLGLDSNTNSSDSKKIESVSGEKNPDKETPSYTNEQIEAAWEETGRVEATCGEDGSVSYKNSLTGKTKSEKIPATGLHTYEVTEHVDATCIADGYETRTCTVCGEVQTEVIPSSGKEHSYELTEKVEPTCTEEGREVYVCSICGDTYTTPIPATGHAESAPVVTKKAGWFTQGESTVYCAICGEVMSTEAIPQTCPMALWQIIAISVTIIAVMIVVIIMTMKSKAKVCLQNSTT